MLQLGHQGQLLFGYITNMANPSRILECNQCFKDYETRASHSLYCNDCVPKENPSKMVTWNRRIRWYGIGKQEWDAMYFELDGTCPICQEKEVTDVEHNHITGEVRGLVCTQCNKGLAFLEKELWLKRANQFLEGELV